MESVVAILSVNRFVLYTCEISLCIRNLKGKGVAFLFDILVVLVKGSEAQLG